MDVLFRKFSHKTSAEVGSPKAFITALLVLLVWAISGPLFGFSDTWQLIINTGTTIVTFLMVFLIQNTQNRDSKSVNLKLDEIIKSLNKADNNMINLDDLTDAQLVVLEQQFIELAQNKEPESN